MAYNILGKRGRLITMDKIKIGGIIQNKNLAQISLLNLTNQPEVAGQIFSLLGREGINVQFIVQAAETAEKGHIVFCIDQKDLEKTIDILRKKPCGGESQQIIPYHPVAIVSIFGPHFREKPAIAGRMFSALSAAGVNILAISTSISTLSCVIPESLLSVAVQVLSETFELP